MCESHHRGLALNLLPQTEAFWKQESYQLIQLQLPVLRHRLSSHCNPVSSQPSTAAVHPALFSCLWHEILADWGVSIEGHSYLVGLRGYSVIPCIPRAREQVLSLSVRSLLPEKSVKPIEWRVSLDIAVHNADNRCTASSFQPSSKT